MNITADVLSRYNITLFIPGHSSSGSRYIDATPKHTTSRLVIQILDHAVCGYQLWPLNCIIHPDLLPHSSQLWVLLYH